MQDNHSGQGARGSLLSHVKSCHLNSNYDSERQVLIASNLGRSKPFLRRLGELSYFHIDNFLIWFSFMEAIPRKAFHTLTAKVVCRNCWMGIPFMQASFSEKSLICPVSRCMQVQYWAIANASEVLSLQETGYGLRLSSIRSVSLPFPILYFFSLYETCHLAILSLPSSNHLPARAFGLTMISGSSGMMALCGSRLHGLFQSCTCKWADRLNIYYIILQYFIILYYIKLY